MIAAKIATMRQGERTDRQPSVNSRKVSQGEAAKLLNVDRGQVIAARFVREQAAPELVKAVEHSKIAVSAAKVTTSRCRFSRTAASRPLARCAPLEALLRRLYGGMQPLQDIFGVRRDMMARLEAEGGARRAPHARLSNHPETMLRS